MKTIAIIVENKEDIAAFANYTEDAGSAPVASEPVAAATPEPAAAAQADLPWHIKLEMPNLSPTMEKGNLVSWGKQVGDEVVPGDVLASIETDKATVDYEMQEEGYVAKLMFPAGTNDVALGEIVAILVENKEDIAAFENYVPGAASAAPV